MTPDITNEIIWKRRSEEFEVVYGLKQGDQMSTTLFNLVLDVIIRKIKVKGEQTQFKNEHQDVAFADDLRYWQNQRKN